MSGPSCTDINACRTITSTVYSCLATIFACTWLAIHPNIPPPDDTWSRRTLRRLGIMTMAVIAPELIVMWALRQWYDAGRLSKKYQDRGWTRVHGFFALMGGFVFQTTTKQLRVVQPASDLPLIDTQDRFSTQVLPMTRQDLIRFFSSYPRCEARQLPSSVAFPDISEAEIRDRSKGDWLSKGLAVVQTTWFVLQCIARVVEGLPMTELEVATCGFALFNAVAYVLWWDKPQGVQVASYVVSDTDRGAWEARKEPSHAKASLWSICSQIASSLDIHTFRTYLYWDKEDIHCALGLAKFRLRSILTRTRRYLLTHSWWQITMDSPLGPFLEMAGLYFHFPSNADHVPRFYSGTPTVDEIYRVSAFTAVLCTAFGLIHCAAWQFEFPSREEQVLGRACSLVITCVPVLVSMITIGLAALVRFGLIVVPLEQNPELPIVYNLVTTISLVLYVVARIIMLVIAFTCLRSLPAGVYVSVSWTRFIPHVS